MYHYMSSGQEWRHGRRLRRPQNEGINNNRLAEFIKKKSVIRRENKITFSNIIEFCVIKSEQFIALN